MTEKDLFDSYKKDVYKTCYYMLHKSADAEDVCQEVFITVFQYDWRQVEHLKTWMMRVTVNQCLNYLKKSSRLTAKEKLLQVQPISNGGKSVETAAEANEMTYECVRMLQKLPGKMRAVVTLRFLNEYSLSEIAQILSIPLGTVKSRLNKGLKQMKLLVDSKGIFYGKEEGKHEQSGASYYSVSK